MKPFIIYLVPEQTSLLPMLDDSMYIEVDGNCCPTESDFHKEIKEKLKFPEYYGNNLDALFDCLIDLEWLQQHNIILHFVHLQNILNQEPAKDYFLSTFLLVISDICSSVEEIKDLDYSEKKLYFIINESNEVRDILNELEIKFEYLY